MKLKTRIVSLVGSLLIGSFFIFSVIGIFFSREAVFKTNTILLEDFNNYEKSRQKEVSSYLNDKVNVLLAKMTGILERTKVVQYWNYFFAPRQFNLDTNLWLTSALFLTANKSLDLIQTTINNKLTSSIILDRPPPYQVYLMDFFEEIKLCVVDPQIPNQRLQGPFIGIPYAFDAEVFPEVLTEMDTTRQLNTGLVNYLMFHPKQVIQFNPQIFDVKTQQFMNIDTDNPESVDYPMNLLEIREMKRALPKLRDYLVKAKAYLLSNPGFYQYITDKQETWIQDQFHNLYNVSDETIVEYNEFEITKVRYQQISMIWQYNSLIATGMSDYNINELAPKGLATIDFLRKTGYGILTKDILINPVVEVVSPSIYRSKDRIFLGDTASIDAKTPSGIRQTFLTIGMDVRDLFKGLSLVTNRALLLVVNQQILYATDQQGNLSSFDPADFPLSTLLSAPTGSFFNKKGDQMVFLTTKLFPDQNVYIVLYRLKSEEFGIIDRVVQELKGFSLRLSLQTVAIGLITLVIAFFLLSRLSQYITTPIMLLAKNTKELQEGHLDKIVLPKVEEGAEDEIEDLYESFSEMVDGLKEKEKVKGILNKVVSPKVATKILQGNVALGGEEKVVTVLFADIRQFTEMTEHMQPSEVIQILNSYLSKLSDVIDKHNGVIDKYVGDEVMALFGAPIADPLSAESAVACAVDMMKEVDAWNQSREPLKLPRVEIGIGIHTGNVVAGNVGAENRLNYTVLGANVNLASRLCHAAKPRQILISENTLQSNTIKERVDFRELEPLDLKGFSTPVRVYEIQGKPTQTPTPS
jgi:class 3 adenylate cyclase